MDSPRDLILKSFLVESAEGLAQMEQAVLELESRPDDAELVQTIFRVVHTMKGNAGILELQNLLSFAHKSEDLLDEIRERRLAVSSEVTTLLLGIGDVLREMAAAAGEGKDELSQRGKDLLRKISDCLAQSSRPWKSTRDRVANAEEAAEPGVIDAGPGTAAAGHKEDACTLRVDVEKLDQLLNLAGEITIARGRVAQLLENKEESSLDEIAEAFSFADGLHLELQETILKTRMVPVGPLFRQFNRTVRDVAKSHGKFARLQIEGEEVEVDTSVVEHLKDPLVHMIRNALDHGIEPPETRQKNGKPPAGTIQVRAQHEGGNILVEVCDDGAGLNRERIVEVARKRGLIADAEKLSDDEVYQLIFETGFSTAAEVNELSGRGVGMDVVRRNVQALRGSVRIASQPGMGCAVQLRIPLTLAIIEGFGVGVGGETYVIPLDQVVECVELPEQEKQAVRKEGIVPLRNEPLPFLYLKDYFGLAGDQHGRKNIVVVQHGAGRAGLAVDALYGTTHTVIKPLPAACQGVPGVSGSAILGNGQVAMILDVPALLRDFRTSSPEAARRA